MTITPDALVAALLRCPIGCAFLLTVERDGIPAALAVAPQQAFTRAAEELRMLNPWIPSFNEATAAVLARAPQLERLAHDLAEQPGADWWAAPVDRERQVLLVDSEPASRTTPASGWNWEDYAERPADWRMTSTLRGGISCGDVVIASGVGDWGDGPLVRRTAVVDAATRVREIVNARRLARAVRVAPAREVDTSPPAVLPVDKRLIEYIRLRSWTSSESPFDHYFGLTDIRRLTDR